MSLKVKWKIVINKNNYHQDYLGHVAIVAETFLQLCESNNSSAITPLQTMPRPPRCNAELPDILEVYLNANDGCEIRIGRGPLCSPRIDETQDAVSEHHCTIKAGQNIDDKTWAAYITDYSSNGTWLNGRKLRKNTWHRINDGDILDITDETRHSNPLRWELEIWISMDI